MQEIVKIEVTVTSIEMIDLLMGYASLYCGVGFLAKLPESFQPLLIQHARNSPTTS